MPKVDLSEIPVRKGSKYPKQFRQRNGDTTLRESQAVAPGLTAFGANRTLLPPGGASSLRHYHTTEDELVIVISGELTLVTDEGEELLRAGDCVGFKAGVANAHHLQNRGAEPAIYYDVGGRDAWDVSTFPDIGLEARTNMEIRFREIGKK